MTHVEGDDIVPMIGWPGSKVPGFLAAHVDNFPMISDGLVVLNKPIGMTSRAALDRAARWFPRRCPIGHAGTLDPLASGVLVLLSGRATRLMEYVQELGKTYVADVVFGATSRTCDAEGPITPDERDRPVSLSEIELALNSLVGIIQQTPPAFSAAKVAGRRAHKLARAGKDVSIAPRPVRIDSIKLVSFEYPRLRIVVRCGKGTYIRSLAVDLGERLGVGGYLAGLQRTAIGPFTIENAVDPDADRAVIQPMIAAVPGFPRITLTDELLNQLAHGQTVAAIEAHPQQALLAAVDLKGDLAAIVRVEGDRLISVKVFWQLV